MAFVADQLEGARRRRLAVRHRLVRALSPYPSPPAPALKPKPRAGAQQVERESLRERFPRWPSFEEWLRARGAPEVAAEWRFRDRTPARIVGDRDDPAGPRDIRAFAPQTQGSEVLYHRLGGSKRGPCFSDRGREIRIHELRRDSVLAALQLSAQKWGTFQVFGSDDYKRLCVELAAEHGFRIINPELQGEIARERRRREHPAPVRPPAHFGRDFRRLPDQRSPIAVVRDRGPDRGR